MNKEYKLKTIKDIYDCVPPDRLHTCLRELANGMVETRNMESSTGMDFTWPDQCLWVDDGKGELDAVISIVSESTNEEVLRLSTKTDISD